MEISTTNTVETKEALLSYDDTSVHIWKKEKTRRLFFYIFASEETEGRKCGTNSKGEGGEADWLVWQRSSCSFRGGHWLVRGVLFETIRCAICC